MSKMRKASISHQTSEPLMIIVDETTNDDDVDETNDEFMMMNAENESGGEDSGGDDSPTLGLSGGLINPYLLSPWRDTRKHSLPTPQCSGITASQVRRLSERGDGGGSSSSPGPRQTEFLATLSTAPAPTPGGRRHSVVTISKVPASLFGGPGGRSGRRESVAAFPTPGRILPSRRESVTGGGGGPPSTEARGSVHNLHLDIMDDIVQARKVRMKLWHTSSEKVCCEVQPLDEAGGVQKYTSSSSSKIINQGTESAGGGVGGGVGPGGAGPGGVAGVGLGGVGSGSIGPGGERNTRRYSDFIGTTLAPIPSSSSSSGRRASELPNTTTSSSTVPSTTHQDLKNSKQSMGIVCTNTDLISILLSSSSSTNPLPPNTTTSTTNGKHHQHQKCEETSLHMEAAPSIHQNHQQNLQNLQQNLQKKAKSEVEVVTEVESTSSGTCTTAPSMLWLCRRHQSSTTTNNNNNKKQVHVQSPAGHGIPSEVVVGDDVKVKDAVDVDVEETKVLWDGRSGSLSVDTQLIGGAIEEFLRRVDSSSSSSTTTTTTKEEGGGGDGLVKTKQQQKQQIKKKWFSGVGSGAASIASASASTSTSFQSQSQSSSSSSQQQHQQQQQQHNVVVEELNDVTTTTSSSCNSSSICGTLKDLFVK